MRSGSLTKRAEFPVKASIPVRSAILFGIVGEGRGTRFQKTPEISVLFSGLLLREVAHPFKPLEMLILCPEDGIMLPGNG